MTSFFLFRYENKNSILHSVSKIVCQPIEGEKKVIRLSSSVLVKKTVLLYECKMQFLKNTFFWQNLQSEYINAMYEFISPSSLYKKFNIDKEIIFASLYLMNFVKIMF